MATAPDDFEFKLLGPLVVASGERELVLGAAKQRALLAVLLLHANEVVSTDRLIDDLWSEEPPARAGHALQVYVSELRKAFRQLGASRDTPLVTRAPGYVLTVDPDRFDLAGFERLAQEGGRALQNGDAAEARELLVAALGLWRGPPLAEFSYSPFAQNEIARLEELRLAVVEERIEADLALGHERELVGEISTLVAEHPLRERLRAQLMLALYRAGRQADALDAYREARETLVEQLGIEPGRPLQELEQAILRQDSRLDAATESTVEPPPQPQDRAVLVFAKGDEDIGALAAFAEPLARVEPAHELILATATSSSLDLAARRVALAGAAAALDEAAEKLRSGGLAVRAAALTSASPGEDVVRLASEQDVDLIVLSGTGLEGEERDNPELATVFARAPCDVALLTPRQAPDAAADGNVLVPFGAGANDWAALELGAWFARGAGATLTVAGVADEEGNRDAGRALANASLALQRFAGVSASPLLLRPGSEDLLEAAEAACLVAVGFSERSGERLGTVRRTLVREARPPVVLVRRGLRPSGLAPRTDLTRFTWSLPATEEP